MKTKLSSQFCLMTQKRFAPLFLTQFLGAFNDNVFKNSLMLIIAYNSIRLPLAGTDVLTNLAAVLFILPFFLFSALAGQMADTHEKSKLIRRIKFFEILIMAGAAAAFFFNHLAGLLILLFLMGTQSAFFGPVKYTILPQHLKGHELVGGNALVEMGTFAAILMGTIAGGMLSQMKHIEILGTVLIVSAIIGWAASRKIPQAPPDRITDLAIDRNNNRTNDQDIDSASDRISWRIFSQTWKALKIARQHKTVFPAILAVSWFRFSGAAYITQFPSFTQQILGGSPGVVTLLLACFSIGIGSGSLLCERLSGRNTSRLQRKNHRRQQYF